MNDLPYLIDHLKIALGLDITVFDSKKELLRSTILNIPDQINILKFHDYLFSKLEKNKNALIYLESNSLIFFLFQNSSKDFFVVGPAITSDIDLWIVEEFKQKVSTKGNFSIQYQKSRGHMLNNFCLIYYTLAKQVLTEAELITDSSLNHQDLIVKNEEVNHYKHENSYSDLEHYSYSFENNFLRAIENGDIEFIDRKTTDHYSNPKSTGKLASSMAKQQEYEVVSLIVLVSRAAIRGGLNPSVAYQLSEVYLQKVANAKTFPEFAQISKSVQLDFTTKVKELKMRNKKKDYVEQTKDYIWNSIYDSNLKVTEVSKALNINNSYLSRAFKEKTGRTIIRYILETKLTLAAEMLKYSNYSIVQIVESLNFASQSHFGKQFKEYFGLTPLQFQKIHKVIDLK